jgi:hypothetical protein
MTEAEAAILAKAKAELDILDQSLGKYVPDIGLVRKAFDEMEAEAMTGRRSLEDLWDELQARFQARFDAKVEALVKKGKEDE